MNKELIKKRFSRKLNVYNSNANIQKQMAKKLITFLPENKYSFALEIGCGTGLLTEEVNRKIELCSYKALDIVEECETYIKKINPKIEFVASDIEEYIETCSEKYDLIISNAALQWLENLPDFVNKLIKKLNKNGVLLFSTFGKENFREIYNVCGKTLRYYSPLELQSQLDNLNPKIEEEIRIISFKTPKEVLKHIQNTGVNAISSLSWTKKNLNEFENLYNNFCSNHPMLTYNPVYVMIRI